MLPVALAIADECAQYSTNSNEEDGELNKLNSFIKESSKEIMNIDEQQNTIPKIKADNIKKSLQD